MNLILASNSPQRKALLEKIGVPFTIQPADVDETPLKNETPLAYVKRIAIAKAEAISKANPGSVVIAADTPVTLGRRILQTPETPEEAFAMLKLQSGRRITINTVVAVADTSGKIHVKVSSSWVKFSRFTDDDINDYIKSNLWRHAAGAVKFAYIGHWMQTFHGSYSGARGLPLHETAQLLARAGIKVNPFGVNT